MDIGSLTVTALIDGEMGGPMDYFYPDDDVTGLTGFDRMFDKVNADMIITIGCYLIRGGDRTILIDTGIGPLPKTPPVAGGTLRSALLGAGVDPSEITDVVFTHLHFDHIGWATKDGEPFFAQATYHCDRRDWDHFMAPEYDTSWEERVTYVETDAARVRLAPLADRMQFWEGDAQILPGLRAVDASGHTPGTCGLMIESDGERGLLLGDIVHTQPELVHAWRFRTHVDADRAHERIIEFRTLLADEDLVCSGSHFPGLAWGRIARDGDNYVWQDLG